MARNADSATRLTRRGALAAAGAGGLLAPRRVAGRRTDGDAATRGVRADTVQLGAIQAVPEWYSGRAGDALGRVTMVDSSDRLEAAVREHPRLRRALGQRTTSDRRATIERFLAATDFGASTLLIVEAVGPDACHDAVAVSNVRVERGRLAACASAVDTCAEDELAAQALTFPAAAVRATADGGVPSAATVAFVDDRGRSGAARASADDPLPSDHETATPDKRT